jgi:hypothetical protein
VISNKFKGLSFPASKPKRKRLDIKRKKKQEKIGFIICTNKIVRGKTFLKANSNLPWKQAFRFKPQGKERSLPYLEFESNH